MPFQPRSLLPLQPCFPSSFGLRPPLPNGALQLSPFHRGPAPASYSEQPFSCLEFSINNYKDRGKFAINIAMECVHSRHFSLSLCANGFIFLIPLHFVHSLTPEQIGLKPPPSNKRPGLWLSFYSSSRRPLRPGRLHDSLFQISDRLSPPLFLSSPSPVFLPSLCQVKPCLSGRWLLPGRDGSVEPADSSASQ